MVGFITDRELERAEEDFPGIGHFRASLVEKPRTFLELVALFEHWREPVPLRSITRFPQALCAGHK